MTLSRIIELETMVTLFGMNSM